MLISPADSLVTNIQTQHFFWEYLQDAERYHFRLVSPAFDSIQSVLIDTTLEDNRLEFTLPEGVYEWSVSALNSAYASGFNKNFRLIIKNDSSFNLTNQSISLQTPLDNIITNNNTLTFNWQPLIAAEKYILQIGDAGFVNLILEEDIFDNSYTFSVPSDNTYWWRVRAVNESSLTMTSWKQRRFTLDQVPPDQPESEFPVIGDTIVLSDQISDLTWSHSADVIRDSVFIYNNAQRDVLVLSLTTSSPEINLDGTPLDMSSGLQDYFWEIISVDQAGNLSSKSPLSRFFIDSF